VRISNGAQKVVDREALSLYLDKLLSCADYKDYAPNGLQIEGRSKIERICTAVTASQDVIKEAVASGAHALIVHHGYFWKGESPQITGMKRQRVAQLLDNQMSLFAYHLPLDCHLELGNNACLARLLDIKKIKSFPVSKTPNLLWTGSLEKPLPLDDFSDVLSRKLNRKPLSICGSNKIIRTIAWCSGGAQDYIDEANQLGVDAYFSGEVSERTYYQAKELGIHYLACGHHATERYGVQALGHHLEEAFALDCSFIDTDNPV